MSESVDPCQVTRDVGKAQMDQGASPRDRLCRGAKFHSEVACMGLLASAGRTPIDAFGGCISKSSKQPPSVSTGLLVICFRAFMKSPWTLVYMSHLHITF